MRAAILAVGTELLGTERVDTNSLLLTRSLRRFGVELKEKVVVGDVLDEVAEQVRRLLAAVDVVLVSGGLGPTADDVTREAVARALDKPLCFDEAVLADIEAKFASFRLPMPGVNRRQAMVIEGAAVLENRRGTAPGLRVDHQSRSVFLFPGVPREMEGLIARSLEPWLQERTAGEELETRVVRVACLPESTVEEKLASVYEEFGHADISVLASPGDIQVCLSARGDRSERAARLEAMSRRVCQLMGDAAYGVGADTSLEATVGALLRDRGLTLATAESCTGGLVAELLTRIPGSTEFFVGGVVTYSDRLKRELLDVSPETLERHGAVSREVVLEMATGAVARLGADFGIAISGIAGPGGGSSEKPVGTVHLALADRTAGESGHCRLHLPGDRRRIRLLAGRWALDMLRRRLMRRGSEAAAREVVG